MTYPHDDLLAVRGLGIRNQAGRQLVHDLSFTVHPGETVALVGESGSGKSLTAKAIIGLLPAGLSATGEIRLHGEDLITASPRRIRQVRGGRIGLLPQDPFTMLNPLIRVGAMLAETLRSSGPARGTPRVPADDLGGEVRRRLLDVGLAPATADRYPWELSGGMRQRIGLAATVAEDPVLLIADEPTTALDATTQRDVLLLLKRIQRQRGMGLLLITHDLRVAFSLSDRVLVMSDGRLLEEATPDKLRRAPKTGYTKKLLAAEIPMGHRRPALGSDRETSMEDTGAVAVADPRPVAPVVGRQLCLNVDKLTKQFEAPSRKQPSQAKWALKGVSLDLHDGVSLGVIGESGSGKTTLVRCLLGLEQPTSGVMEVDGHRYGHVGELSPEERDSLRTTMQCVFQDPYSSLNPSHSIGYILREAMHLRTGARPTSQEVAEETEMLLAEVGLPADLGKRRPGTLSGGQRQRVAIARALAMRPKLLICDEPVAALDASVQAQVLEVLRKVQAKGINLLFITHDLPVVRTMTDEVAVLYQGTVVERGLTAEVLDNPQHEYTKKLIAAVPTGSRDWLAEESSPLRSAACDRC